MSITTFSFEYFFSLLTDPCKAIIDGMSNKRSKPAIIKKCLDLGLIMDKKELHIKRGGGGSGKGKKKKSTGDREDDFVVDSSDGKNICISCRFS